MFDRADLREADLLGADATHARCSLEDLRGALHVMLPFEVRRAGDTDTEAIAAAHSDSVESIGPRFYGTDVVRAWRDAIEPRLYREAMARGERFFVAATTLDGRTGGLGFSSHYVQDGEHGVAVYVRGMAARRGIGSALLRAAENSAAAAGAARVRLDASLAAVDFYKANGFTAAGRGEHTLRSGCTMACVFMQKNLGGVGVQ